MTDKFFSHYISVFACNQHLMAPLSAYCISRTGLDWTGLDWASKTRTSKTRTGKTWTDKTRTSKTQIKMLALLTRLSTIQRTSKVKIRGIITLNINVYNTNKSTNKIHNLI